MDFTILCDTREQKNFHITRYFDRENINYASKKLNVGDYTIGIIKDGEKFSFEDKIVVERKGSGETGLDELAINLTAKRKQFIKELNNDIEIHLVIEDGTWEKLFKGKYRSEMNINSYVASLMTFLHRYNIHIHMVERKNMGKWMYNLFYYYLRERRKDNGNKNSR
ncbi:MAG: ERCC4 domain-containing protein [bacterium]